MDSGIKEKLEPKPTEGLFYEDRYFPDLVTACDYFYGETAEKIPEFLTPAITVPLSQVTKVGNLVKMILTNIDYGDVCEELNGADDDSFSSVLSDEQKEDLETVLSNWLDSLHRMIMPDEDAEPFPFREKALAYQRGEEIED